MSDTPETDLEESAQTQRFGGYMVKAAFARNLERQRNEARAEIARLQMELDASCNAEELRQVREENARLQNELEKVERILYSLTP